MFKTESSIKGLCVFVSAIISLAFCGLLMWLFNITETATLLTWGTVLAALTSVELHPRLCKSLLVESK